jgi:hypothetical protein
MDQILEHLTGIGTLAKSDGSIIGTRHYDITVARRMLDDGRGGTIPSGLRRISGSIHLQQNEGRKLVIDGDALVLTLEDGRSLPFSLTNESGQIAPKGELK